jgi:DNA-binding transcriptional ArsR family regulator
MTDGEKLARIFKALSAETRIRIVQLLKGRAMCVGALSARLDVTQGAVSQHLRVLREANLVIAEKRGYYVHYRVNEKTLSKWERATAQLLGTQPSARAACPGNRGGKLARGVCK